MPEGMYVEQLKTGLPQSTKETDKYSLASFVSSRVGDDYNDDDDFDESPNQIHKIPFVAICANGGHSTLKEILVYLQRKIPVLLIKVNNQSFFF
jgi:hypothetical protein